MKRSWALEMMSNIQRKKFALNFRRDGPQPSILVRSFRSFTILAFHKTIREAGRHKIKERQDLPSPIADGG